MAIERARRWLPSAAFALACAHCSGGAATPEPKTTAAAASGVARYLPLEDGTVFSYDTLTQPSGERGLLVLEIRRRPPDVVELWVAGRARRLSVSERAVAHVTGGFLLREPLAEGETWRGDFGHVRLTSASRKVTVPAGSYEDCIETVEEMTTNAGTKRTTTAFCPGVGIAQRETEAEQDGEAASERISLRSFGRRFDGADGGEKSP